MGGDTIVSSVTAAITIIMTATLDRDNCLSIMTALDCRRHTYCTEETHPLDRTLGCWAHGSGVAWAESQLLLDIALVVILVEGLRVTLLALVAIRRLHDWIWASMIRTTRFTHSSYSLYRSGKHAASILLLFPVSVLPSLT